MTGRPMRASDRDRDDAVRALSDHYAEGRLDHDEFESRLTTASKATYLHDLDPLFADLPARPRSTKPLEVPRLLPAGRARPHRPFVPLLLLAVAIVVTLTHAPWLLLPAWVGLTWARRRAWQRRGGVYAEIPQHPRARGRRQDPVRGWDH